MIQKASLYPPPPKTTNGICISRGNESLGDKRDVCACEKRSLKINYGSGRCLQVKDRQNSTSAEEMGGRETKPEPQRKSCVDM